MRRKFKKSTWISLALFIYVTAMAIYFLPRNTQIGDVEKWVTLGVSYVIVIVLWFVLRKKEQLRDQRENDKGNKN
ncbi:hypothetical protein LJC05_02965 [Bacteroides sp. OttesenSCG-928-J23]|nr:hypothetical protein [Bacteroides sp. OttesenSCG-928-J23]